MMKRLVLCAMITVAVGLSVDSDAAVNYSECVPVLPISQVQSFYEKSNPGDVFVVKVPDGESIIVDETKFIPLVDWCNGILRYYLLQVKSMLVDIEDQTAAHEKKTVKEL